MRKIQNPMITLAALLLANGLFADMQYEEAVAVNDGYRIEMRRPAEAIETSTSSYQGTTTGPGPNGGYPGTPRGAYDVNERPMGR